MRRLWSLVLVGWFLAAGAYGGPEAFEGKRISIIRFVPAEQPLPPAELEQILPIRMKMPLRLSDVRAALDRLYATGRYENIEIDAQPDGDSVAITFRTTNRWFVGRVTLEGAKPPPSRDAMRDATKLDLGSLYFDERGEQAGKSITRSLLDNGFYNSRVRRRLEYGSRTQQVHIHFEVETGPRARFGPPAFTGDLQRTPAKLIRTSRWHGWLGWRPFTDNRLNRGLERIRDSYLSRDYLLSNVQLVELKHDAAALRLSPVVAITAGKRVSVRVTGAEIPRGKLRRLIPTFEEQSIDRELLNEGLRNLTEYLQSEGYFEARVEVRSPRMENGVEIVGFVIQRGARHKLVEVEIHGNNYFNRQIIRERMSVTAASLEYRRGRYSRESLDRDADSIRDLYRSNGFRDCKVETEVLNDYRGKTGEVAAIVKIVEGGQWLVSKLDLDGVEPAEANTLRALISSGPGQPFSEAAVATDRDNLLANFYDRGYPDATFEWIWKPTPDPHRVVVSYHIQPGRREYVREVLIGGLDATRPQLVNSRILLNPGEPLSQSRMIETQRRLNDLGIFAKVDVAVQNPDGDEPAKYVLYQLEESKKYSVSGGLGFEVARIGGGTTSFDSPAGQAGFSPRASMDLTRLNFRGLGHAVSVRGSVSTLRQRALFSYTAPQFMSHERLTLSFVGLFDDSQDVRTYASRRWEGSTQLSHRWTRSKSVQYRFSYRRVGVDPGSLRIDPALIPLLSQPVRVGMLSGTYIDDRRDNPLDAHSGTHNTLDLGLASKAFGSQVAYTRMLARNSTYHRLGNRLVLARTMTFAFLGGLGGNPAIEDPTQDIPLPERFFAGGASSHRGFPDNQAGPRDLKTGFPLGGKAMLVAGTELRFPVLGNTLGGVLFHDAGNVYSSVSGISFRALQRDRQDFNYMVHAVGIGFRYRTPIGPLRLDLAYSVNPPRFFGFKGTTEELLRNLGTPTDQRISRFQFHFSLGQAF
jgi:outer membrane protein assembly complex protein YaeT